jgi:hypothetical protein
VDADRTLHIGDWVEITGLGRKANMRGSVGRIVWHNPESREYGIKPLTKARRQWSKYGPFARKRQDLAPYDPPDEVIASVMLAELRR